MTSSNIHADLHIHSASSTRAADWVLRRLDFPASASDPFDLYRKLRAAGMRFVTLTDQNTINGCLEIAHLPDVIIGEEVSTVFPEDECRVHVLVWGINEAQHRDIQQARRVSTTSRNISFGRHRPLGGASFPQLEWKAHGAAPSEVDPAFSAFRVPEREVF
jgi:predicted metal-dependent phosphoesterase TrpH